MIKKDSVTNKIKKWARAQNNVDAVILNGSRTNPCSKIDELSDYDIAVVVKDIEKFRDDDQWLKYFGEIMIMFKDTIDNPDIDNLKSYTRLVQYKNGLRIDFNLWSHDFFSSLKSMKGLPAFLDTGYEIIYDRNDVITDLKKPRYSGYNINKPEKKRFMNNINSFWWDIIYVGKALKRDELFFAKYMMEDIRFKFLQRMIEWYISMKNNWEINPGKCGRGFKKYLSNDEWNELSETFTGFEKEHNWKCLFNLMDFFRKIAIEVSINLGYEYPKQTDEEVTEYMKKIKEFKCRQT